MEKHRLPFQAAGSVATFHLNATKQMDGLILSANSAFGMAAALFQVSAFFVEAFLDLTA